MGSEATDAHFRLEGDRIAVTAGGWAALVEINPDFDNGGWAVRLGWDKEREAIALTPAFNRRDPAAFSMSKAAGGGRTIEARRMYEQLEVHPPHERAEGCFVAGDDGVALIETRGLVVLVKRADAKASVGLWQLAEMRVKLVECFRRGDSVGEAAAACLITSRQLRRWIRRGAEDLRKMADEDDDADGEDMRISMSDPHAEYALFYLEVKQAQAAVAVDLKGHLRQAAKEGAWPAAQKLLEYHDPEAYGRRQRIDFGKLSDEQLVRLIEEAEGFGDDPGGDEGGGEGEGAYLEG